jgi:transcriptional regulator with XRE-family HTH domain
MTFQKLFITNLKGFRKVRNISPGKLAEICATGQNYIENIEAGKLFPSLDMIEKIAAALEIESYRLFQDNDSTDSKTLTPLQKQDIINMLHKAASEIIYNY